MDQGLMPPITRQRIGEGVRRKHATDAEFKARFCRSQRRRWTPERRAAHGAAMRAAWAEKRAEKRPG